MKKLYIILPILSILFWACQNDDNEKFNEEVVLKSEITAKQLYSMQEQIKNGLNVLKSSEGTFHEEEMRTILLPLVEEGERFRQEILDFMEEENYSIYEIVEVANMPESYFTELSFILAVQLTETQSTIIDCLGVALGISAIRDIVNGTAGLITAKSGLQILKLMGVRYLGYLGLAYAVYSFVECVS